MGRPPVQWRRRLRWPARQLLLRHQPGRAERGAGARLYLDPGHLVILLRRGKLVPTGHQHTVLSGALQRLRLVRPAVQLLHWIPRARPSSRPSGTPARRSAASPPPTARSSRTTASDADGTGIPFRYNSLPTDFQTIMTTGGADGTKRVNWLRGDPEQRGRRLRQVPRPPTTILGDIVNSSPQYVGPPNAGYAGNDYAEFVLSKRSRKPVLYVGANDGMMHAFSAKDEDGGKELFAYDAVAGVQQAAHLTRPRLRPHLHGRRHTCRQGCEDQQRLAHRAGQRPRPGRPWRVRARRHRSESIGESTARQHRAVGVPQLGRRRSRPRRGPAENRQDVERQVGGDLQ